MGNLDPSPSSACNSTTNTKSFGPRSSRALTSLYQSLINRQIQPFKVFQSPYAGNWTAGEEHPNSCILMIDNSGIAAPPLTLSFTERTDNGNLLAVADEEGFVNILNTSYSLPRQATREFKKGVVGAISWLAHNNAIFDVSWIKEDTHMLTASGDQSIKLWDIEKGANVGVMNGHGGSVKSISRHPSESDLFVSGSRDGCVALWDLRTSYAAHLDSDVVAYAPVATIKDAHKGFTPKFSRCQGYTRTVTAVLYLKDERVIATAGANDGVIKYWDSRKLKTPIFQTLPEGQYASATGRTGSRIHGIAGLSQDPSGTRLIATCVDSKIYMYDVLRPEKGSLKTFSGHVMGTFYIKAAFSPDGSHILSGSSDHDAYIWEVDAVDNEPTVLTGHLQEVTSVAWCPTDFCKIATCSDDYTVRVWSLKDPRFPTRVKQRRLTPNNIAVALDPAGSVAPSAQWTSGFEDVDHGRIVSDDPKTTNKVAILNQNSSSLETTPPPKRSRAFQSTVATEIYHEDIKDKLKTLEAEMRHSPSSVLSPQGSSFKKRKTIVDYFALPSQFPTTLR